MLVRLRRFGPMLDIHCHVHTYPAKYLLLLCFLAPTCRIVQELRGKMYE